MGYVLINVEAESGGRLKNPDANDLAMRGLAFFNSARAQSYNQELINAALAAFERALKIDPNEADALGGEAAVYTVEYFMGTGSPGTDYDTKILGSADKAMALAPRNFLGALAKSYYLGLSKRFKEAIGTADASLAVNPNYAGLYAARAHAEIALGRFDQAKADLRQAMLLSPRDVEAETWRVSLGDAEFGAGNVKAAMELYEKSIEAGVHGYYAYGNLAAAYALQGRMEEAHSALAEAVRLNPSFTVKWYVEHAMDLPLRTDGLRKAGLPEV